MRRSIALAALAVCACAPAPPAVSPRPAPPAIDPAPETIALGPTCSFAKPGPGALAGLERPETIERPDDDSAEEARDLLSYADVTATACFERSDGSCRQATELYREILAGNRGGGVARYATYQLGVLLYHQARYDEAARAMLDSRELAAREGDAPLRVAAERKLPLYLARDAHDASAALERYAAVDASSSAPLLSRDALGEAFIALGRGHDAEAVFNRLVTDEPWSRCVHGARALEAAVLAPDGSDAVFELVSRQVTLLRAERGASSSWYFACLQRTAAPIYQLAVDRREAFQSGRAGPPPEILLEGWERAVGELLSLVPPDELGSLVLYREPLAHCPTLADLMALWGDLAYALNRRPTCASAYRHVLDLDPPSALRRQAERMIIKCERR